LATPKVINSVGRILHTQAHMVNPTRLHIHNTFDGLF